MPVAAIVLLIALPAAIPLAGAHAQSPAINAAEPLTSGHALTLSIEGARGTGGLIRVAVFAIADGFPGNQDVALRREEWVIRSASDTVVFPHMPSGRYAIAVHHDENGNRRMDTRAFGLPREGWGASGDPRPKLRAPRFEEAAFDLSGPMRIAIRLTY